MHIAIYIYIYHFNLLGLGLHINKILFKCTYKHTHFFVFYKHEQNVQKFQVYSIWLVTLYFEKVHSIDVHCKTDLRTADAFHNPKLLLNFLSKQQHCSHSYSQHNTWSIRFCWWQLTKTKITLLGDKGKWGWRTSCSDDTNRRRHAEFPFTISGPECWQAAWQHIHTALECQRQQTHTYIHTDSSTPYIHHHPLTQAERRPVHLV